MKRDIFLQELRIALQGNVSQIQVNEQLQYYENYIIEESRKGRTEEEVTASLGSPRLIAKTIIQISGDTACQDGQTAETYREQSKREDTPHRRLRPGFRHRRFLAGICFILFLILLVKIGLFLLPMLASVFMIAAMCYLVFQIFFKNKK